MPVNRTNSWKLRLGVALSIALGAPDCVFAQAAGTSGPTSDVANQTHQEQALNQQHREVNLDLSSTEAVFQSRNANAVNIHVGGSIENGVVTGAVMQTINPGQLLTPAQFMAVKEVLGGGQTLLLNDFGQAVGGYATITSNRVHNLSSIVVPQNVSLNAIGFNASTPLNVSGNLNVFGSMFALQNAANVVSVLQAGNLNIGVGGLLSGSLPATMNPGSSIFSSAGLTVNVANSVTNMGTIATLGGLNITAGGSIVNQSLANTTALMSAQNINLTTGVGQIVNSGLIQALNNININTLSSLTNLSIDSSKGVLNALGSINVRDALATVAGNTTLQGGSWISQELNLQSGEGALEVSVETVAGTMNLGAGSAHVLANTPMLTLGNAIITGDPTYVNAGGDIQIVGTISENEDLAIIASGNITAGGAARIINHGHDVWLIAGANVDTSSGSCVGCGNSGLLTTPGSATTITGGFVKVTATGAKGGSIDLSTGNTVGAGNTVIDTTASTTNGAGGNVNLVALANGSTGGRILFPGSTITSINTSGAGSGTNGNVRLVAGATSGQAISVGAITANGGSGAAANILLTASQASFSGGSGGCSACISFNSTGTATGNIASTTPVNGGITISGPILSANGLYGSISVLTPTGNLQVTGSLTAYEVTLVSASGTVGSAGSPIEINNGGGDLRLFISSDVVNITNSTTENITLANTVSSSLKANTSFTITTNRNIVAATNDSIAISSPNISLWGTGSSNFGSGANESQYLMTAATNTLFASGYNVYLRNKGDLQGFSANAEITLHFINTGNVTLNGPVHAHLSTASINLNGQGNSLNLNGQEISSQHILYVKADGINIGTGTISAKLIQLQPHTDFWHINIGGGTTGLQLSNADFAQISASDLYLGNTMTGQINIYGKVDFSGKNYNVSFFQGRSKDSTFNNQGTIELHGSNLRIDSTSSLYTGNIVSTAPAQFELYPDYTYITGDINSNGGKVIIQRRFAQSPGTKISADWLSISSTETTYIELDLAVSRISLPAPGAKIVIRNSAPLIENADAVYRYGFDYTDLSGGGITTTGKVSTKEGPIVFRTSGAVPSPIAIGGSLSAAEVSIISNGGAITINAPVNATTVTIDASTAGSPSPVSINTPGQIVGDVVSIHGNGGTVTVNAPIQSTSLSIDNIGSGAILGSGAIAALSYVTLGKAGSSGAIDLTSLSTPGLSFNTSGNVSIVNSSGLTSTGASTGGVIIYTDLSAAGMSITAPVIASGALSISTTALSNGNITVGANVSGTNVSITAHNAGGIAQSTGTIVASSSLFVSSGTGNIGISSASTPSLTVSSTGVISVANSTAGVLSLSSTGSKLGTLSVSTNHAISFGSALSTGDVTLAASSIALFPGSLTPTGSVHLTCDDLTISSGTALEALSISVNGATTNGSVGALTAMTVNNSGTLRATGGNISLVSALGQDLVLSGNGSGLFEVSNGRSISVTARDNPSVRGPGLRLASNLTFSTGTGTSPSFVSFSATGTGAAVTIDAGVTLDFPSDYTYAEVFTNSFNGSFSQIALHTVGHSNPNSTLSVDLLSSPGTIANAYGSVDLSQLSTLRYSGSNLAIISAYDIVNSNETSITLDLSNSSGSGGSLTLLAGFTFTPGAFSVGPTNKVYSLTGTSAQGGSIKLDSVSVNTSGSASGGGILAVASAGASSSGSISLGAITTTGGTGFGGAVTLIGNSITTGATNSKANALANSGSVTLTSTGSVSLSNPGSMQATNGAVTGGTFQAGTLAGAITLPNFLNAGQGNITIRGGSIDASGLITGRNLTLTATAGSITALTAVDNNITATAAGAANSSVLISNASNLSNFAASTTGSKGDVSLINNGNVSLSGPVSGPGSVSLILTSGKTLTNNGFQISSNNLVNLVIDTYSLTGTTSINAGTGTVSIVPSTSTRAISLGGGAGLVVSVANMSGITAGTLILGSEDTTGGITVGGSIDFSTKYNLQLKNGGDGGFEANGGTLTVGSKSLVIDVGGKVNLAGILTNGANLEINGQSINLNNSIGSSGDTTYISSTFGDIISSGTITAKNLTLNANGYIGKAHAEINNEHKFTPMETAVTGMLNLIGDDHHLFGMIAVNNTGNLSSFSVTSTSDVVSPHVSFYNKGDVTLGGHVSTSSVYGKIFLTLSPGSTLSLNGYHVDSRATYISTDHLIIGNVAPGDYSVSGGNIQIWPTSPQGVINLGGGTGGLCLSNADLNTFKGIRAELDWRPEPVIGSYSNYGGIHVWGPIDAPNVAFQQADGRTPEFNHMNGGDFISHGNAVTALWIDCTGGAVSVAAGSKLQAIVGGSVTIEGPITAQTIYAYQGGITAFGTITGAGGLVALKGGITAETASTGLTLVALGGDINVINTGNLNNLSAAAPSGSVSLTNTGNITIARAWYSSPWEARGYGVDSSADDIGRYGVYGSKGVSIFQDAASTFTHSSQRIVTKNSPINLVVNSYQGTTAESESGLLHAGTGTVSITPSSNTATVSLFSNAGTIAINSMVFGEIIAGN